MKKVPNLYVDLDHTYLKTDSLQQVVIWLFFYDILILIKSFFSGFSLKGFSWLKAKSKLSRACIFDLNSIPKNKAVVDLINEHKQANGKVILATAAHKHIAEFFKNDFDDVIASDDLMNAKGQKKLDLIKIHNSKTNNPKFYYAGDSINDIVIFKEAQKAYVVGNLEYFEQNSILLKPDEIFIPITFKNWWRNLFFMLYPIIINDYSSKILLKTLMAFFLFTFFRFSIENLINIKNIKPGSSNAFNLFAFCNCGIIFCVFAILTLDIGFLIPGIVNFLDLIFKTSTTKNSDANFRLYF